MRNKFSTGKAQIWEVCLLYATRVPGTSIPGTYYWVLYRVLYRVPGTISQVRIQGHYSRKGELETQTIAFF
jgi:hypothetical protein